VVIGGGGRLLEFVRVVLVVERSGYGGGKVS